jgi:hypothetical protein
MAKIKEEARKAGRERELRVRGGEDAEITQRKDAFLIVNRADVLFNDPASASGNRLHLLLCS